MKYRAKTVEAGMLRILSTREALRYAWGFKPFVHPDYGVKRFMRKVWWAVTDGYLP